MISPNVIIIWPGTVGSIPSGYERVTDFDSRFPKVTADQTDPGDSGGNSTHTHTSSSHNHSVSAHTHTGQTAVDGQEDGECGTDANDTDLSNSNHYHTYSVSTIVTNSVASEAVTYSAFSNSPPYYDVIFIKATGYRPVPDDAIMYFRDSSVPSGWTQHSASNDKYFRGADYDDDGGGTGGSTTNTHTIDHTHSVTHSHYGLSNGPNTVNTPGQEGGIGVYDATATHRQPITLNNKVQTSSTNSSIGSQSETVEPAYKKLLAIQNTSGASAQPQKYMIGLWTGALADIPSGWRLCDGGGGTQDMRGKYIKNAATAGAIGDTGGSNTHTHIAEGHTHTLASHTHTVTVSAGSDTNNRRGRSGTLHHYWTNYDSNPHSGSSDSDAQTGALASSNTTADSSSNEPLNYTVALIEFLYSTQASFLFGMT